MGGMMSAGYLWYKFVRRPWKISSNSFVVNTLLLFTMLLLENGDLVANENGQFPCRFCGKTFSMKHVAKRHEKKLHIEKKEENLPTPKNLMGHFLDYKTDVNESGRFPCTFCSKTFSLKHVAKRHEMSHTKEG